MSLVLDSGTIYGATASGGSEQEGTVFELDADGTEQTLHNFDDNPAGGLVEDKSGDLYGITWGGGLGFGTIYELVK